MFNVMNRLIVEAQIRRQQGQGLVEYGLIIALVSVAAVAALNTLSGDVNTVFRGIGATLNP
jgi:pilus assembly protein Flp/PilA